MHRICKRWTSTICGEFPGAARRGRAIEVIRVLDRTDRARLDLGRDSRRTLRARRLLIRRCMRLSIPLALWLTASAALAKPYTQTAPSMSSYVQSHGFKTPTNPNADLNSLHPLAHRQLEAFLLEGAEAGAKVGDPVLLAWFAAADASLAPWRLSNCGDYDWDIDTDCDVLPWGPSLWQVGLGVQVSDHNGDIAQAFAVSHPNHSPKSVGDEVLKLAAQSLSFPSGVSVAALAANPGAITQGRHNSYWLATLARDMRVSAYLETPSASSWPCYRSGYPSWCNWYREPAHWQEYSDVLSMVIRSWNSIQSQWKSALVRDVIVDDASSAFSLSGSASADGKGGWRGRFTWAKTASSASVVATWSTELPVAGSWEVSAFVPYSDHAALAHAKLEVTASDGTHSTFVDQSVAGGDFHAVGTYHFESAAKVVGTNAGGTGKNVGFDALRFRLVSPTPDGGGGGNGNGVDAGPGKGAGGSSGTAGAASSADASTAGSGGAASDKDDVDAGAAGSSWVTGEFLDASAPPHDAVVGATPIPEPASSCTLAPSGEARLPGAMAAALSFAVLSASRRAGRRAPAPSTSRVQRPR